MIGDGKVEKLRNKLNARATQTRQRAAQAKQELDRKLLELTSTHFEKVRRILVEKRQKWEDESDVAYKLAEKVLAKAKFIRETLVPADRKKEKQKEEGAPIKIQADSETPKPTQKSPQVSTEQANPRSEGQ